MKLKVSITTNLKIKAVQDKVKEATARGLKDVIIDMAGDVVKGSPVAEVGGGTNRRSIEYKAKGLSGSIYSTSKYGGYLEVGTYKMAARPYFRPALDKHCKKLPERIKERLR